jgi:trigger factor
MMERKLGEGDITVSISDEQDCKKVVSVEIAQERYRDEKERVLKSLVRRVAIPGFRKGKAPEAAVRQRFGETITNEALKNILPLAYGHIVDSEKLEPIGEPVFSEVKEEDSGHLTFKIDIEVVPRFELTGYKGVKVDAEPIEVKSEEIDDVLRNLQERNAEYATVDRPAVTGDVVTIDYVPLRLDGSPDDEKRVTGYNAQLGIGQLFPAFESAITGKTAGFKGTVDIQYPEDYGSEELSGRTVSYSFIIKEIKEKRIPPFDDGFAKKVDEGLESMEDLRADIEKRLRQEKERDAERRREERAIDIIIDRNPFEVPLSMRRRYEQELRDEDDRRRRAVGAPPEEDEEKNKQMDELIGRIALRNIKRYFVMESIAEREGVEVSDEDLTAELERISGESGRPIKDVKGYFKRGSDQLDGLKNRLRERKILGIILGAEESGAKKATESEES